MSVDGVGGAGPLSDEIEDPGELVEVGAPATTAEAGGAKGAAAKKEAAKLAGELAEASMRGGLQTQLKTKLARTKSGDKGWDELTPDEQKHWGTLGWGRANWKDGPPPASSQKSWSQLSPAEQQAANALHYDEASWNKEKVPLTGLVPDKTPVFKADGSLDGVDLMKKLTQFDRNPITKDDPRRCGATAAIAVAAFSGGASGLKKLAAYVGSKHTPDADTKAALERIKNGTATYGDLGRLGSFINKHYAKADGMHGPDLGKLLKDAGITPPTGDHPGQFPNGTAWPMMIDAAPGDGVSKGNHWLVVGKDKNGRVFFYDPWPKPGTPQLVVPGMAEYKRLLQIARSDLANRVPATGFAKR